MLTLDAIRTMPAGPEMDAAVAEHFEQAFTVQMADEHALIVTKTTYWMTDHVQWEPSTNWSDAAFVWKALPTLGVERGQWVYRREAGQADMVTLESNFGRKVYVIATGADFPEAVCRAFLMAAALKASPEPSVEHAVCDNRIGCSDDE